MTFFLQILDDQDKVATRQSDPLILQLDTFVETIGCKPMLRGPRLHAVQASFRT